jgi:hypothetical protein
MQVKNWHMHGIVRLLFKPLTASIPGFGAIVVSLNEPVHVLPQLLSYTAHQLQETFQ